MVTLRHKDMQVVVQWLIFIHLLVSNFANSQNFERQTTWDSNVEESEMFPSRQFEKVVLSNGIINLTLTVPDGQISGIAFKGNENILETQNEDDNRGYWDMVWNNTPNHDITHKFSGSNYKIVRQSNSTTEISFTREWTYGGTDVPLKFDKRFVLLKDCPGFYTYTVMEHQKGWPAFAIQYGRLVLKFQDNKFHYMAMSDARQRIMPGPKDRANGQVLDYKEAVQLTNPSNPDLKGEVDDKYYYITDNKDNKVHGWVGDDGVGVWMITPSNEFRAGGPFSQSLTSHVGPTMLNVFSSTHYAGEILAIKIESSEDWKMVWGPVFVYLNSDPSAKQNPSKLWDDAKKRSQQEANNWPYSFPLSNDYLKSKERGTIKGQLLVLDSFKNKNAIPAASAYVGLARPGDAGSWQYENKGYQFWTQTDKNGYFTIKNVIPGTYSLYASVPGVIGDYKHGTDFTITAGSVAEAKDVVYHAPRNGPTLWEIGIPDRTAAEFFIPDPSPRFKVHKYPLHVEKFREYGLWARYTDLYPKEDLVFTIGKSDYRKDWFFAHLTRKVGTGFQPTTWKIIFKLEKVEKQGNYTLQLAIAGALAAEVQVRVNNPNSNPVLFSTGMIGKENIIARHAIHGMYRLFSIGIPGNALVNGDNTIFLKQPNAVGPFAGLMYDYIRLEGPHA